MFYDELEPLHLCDLLFEERALDLLAHDKITGKKQRQKQIEHLLETIEKNEHDCFHFFLYILWKNKYKFILETLERSTPRVVSNGMFNLIRNNSIIFFMYRHFAVDCTGETFKMCCFFIL